MTEAQTGGAAYAAHVAGAVFEALTARFFEDPERLAAELQGSLLRCSEHELCTTLGLCNRA